MTKNLYTLDEKGRRIVNEQYGDPEAWQMVEDRTNRELRSQIVGLAKTIGVARENPDDPDCRRLLDLLKNQ